jgi:hypothetical protein
MLCCWIARMLVSTLATGMGEMRLLEWNILFEKRALYLVVDLHLHWLLGGAGG